MYVASWFNFFVFYCFFFLCGSLYFQLPLFYCVPECCSVLFSSVYWFCFMPDEITAMWTVIECSFFYFSHTWYKCKVSVWRNFAPLLFLWQLKKLTVYACQESTKWCLVRLFHVLRTWQNWTKWYYYKHAGFWIASLKISSCLWALYLCLLYFTSLYYGCRWEYLIWWLRILLLVSTPNRVN